MGGMPMAKNKTEIKVTAVYDGELDASDVFIDLIAQKYGKNSNEHLVRKECMEYNNVKGSKEPKPSGLCG